MQDVVIALAMKNLPRTVTMPRLNESCAPTNTTNSQSRGAVEGGQQRKLRKVWLHTAVEPMLDGSGHHTCRYCGTVLTAQNISIRKQVY
jgi:hypothetical protein